MQPWGGRPRPWEDTVPGERRGESLLPGTGKRSPARWGVRTHPPGSQPAPVSGRSASTPPPNSGDGALVAELPIARPYPPRGRGAVRERSWGGAVVDTPADPGDTVLPSRCCLLSRGSGQLSKDCRLTWRAVWRRRLAPKRRRGSCRPLCHVVRIRVPKGRIRTSSRS